MGRKVCLVSDARSWRVGEVDVCPKSDPHPTPGNQWGKSFYRQRDGVVGAATCRNRTVSSTVTFRWVISGLTSDVLIVLGTVNLQFQGPFVPISLWPVLGIVAGIVLGTVWSS